MPSPSLLFALLTFTLLMLTSNGRSLGRYPRQAGSVVPCEFRPGFQCGCVTMRAATQKTSYESSDSIFKVPEEFMSEVTQQTSTDRSIEYTVLGDMVFRRRLSESQPRSQSSDQASPENLSMRYWPGGLIFYLIDPGFSADYQKTVKRALQEIVNHVGNKHLEFREARTASGRVCRKSYLFIKKVEERYCRAEVGMQQGNFTFAWLNQHACPRGTIVHEILHTLGRYHEQCRRDRDSYVTLIQSEMIREECGNFLISTSPDKTLEMPYDWDSIMHYGSCHFTCRGQYTMTKKDGGYIAPNRQSLTQIDIDKIRLLYPKDAKVNYEAEMCKDPRGAASSFVSNPLFIVLLTTLNSMATANVLLSL